MPDHPADTQARFATVDDVEHIAAVLRRAFSEYEPLYTPAAYAATTPTADQLRQRWSEGPVWVALHAGEIAGTVAAVPKTQALYIRSMASVPEARGRGIGRVLLGEAERWARAGGFQRLYLSTTPFLLAAIRLYEGWGFQKTAAGPHELLGTPLVTMEKVF